MNKRQNDDHVSRYALSGMAAFLPGMQYMIELMQRQLDEFRAELAALQHGEAAAFGEAIGAPTAKRKVNRPKSSAAKSGWSGMTAEERSVEMRRRMAVAKQGRVKEQPAASHPRDPRHPGHEAWIAKLKVIQKANWARKTKAQREVHVGKMGAGRAKARKLAIAS